MKLCVTCHLQFEDQRDVCPQDNTPLIVLGHDPLLGTTIHQRYRLESLIGKGSMGMVYQATQELINRQVAVKVLHSHLVSEADSLKRFHQQAKAASRLHHPHIITLYDYGIINGGQPFIVMDLLKGPTLGQLLEEKRVLSLDEILPIFKQICSALADAHKCGVVHRDVKPDNVVLELKDDKYWVKVVDFGIAKLLRGTDETHPRITKTGMVCGSPAYMSPEQYQGKDVDQRSDIYSLGSVLFESLTGRLPFTAVDLVGLMTQHLTEKPPALTAFRMDVPAALEKFMYRALAKRPEDRPQSMDDFYQELEAAARQPDLPGLSSISRTGLPSPAVDVLHFRETLEEPLPVVAAQARSSRAEPEISPWLTMVSWGQIFLPYILAVALLSMLAMVFSLDPGLSQYFQRNLNSLLHSTSTEPSNVPRGNSKKTSTKSKKH